MGGGGGGGGGRGRDLSSEADGNKKKIEKDKKFHVEHETGESAGKGDMDL